MVCVYCSCEMKAIETNDKAKHYLFPKDNYPGKLMTLAANKIKDEEYTRYLQRINAPESMMTQTDRIIVSLGMICATAQHYGFEYRLDRNKIIVTVEGHEYIAYHVCPQCHSIVPDIDENEELLRIGLVGAEGSGKTSFVCSIANNYEKYCSGRFTYEAVSQGVPEGVDLLQDSLRRRITKFSKGTLERISSPTYLYPYMLRVMDARKNKSLILCFYDIAGSFLKDNLIGHTQHECLNCLKEAGWVFYFIDAVNVFGKNGQKKYKENRRILSGLMDGFEEKYILHSEDKPGAGIIVTKIDKYINKGDGFLGLYAQCKANEGYQPDIECIGRHFIFHQSAVQEFTEKLKKGETGKYKYIGAYMLSACGGTVSGAAVKNKNAEPIHLFAAINDMLLQLMG